MTRNENSSLPNIWQKGYFAFPPGGVRLPLTPSQNITTTAATDDDNDNASLRATKEQAWKERCQRDAETRQGRLERERALALLGEMEWVRAGGTLRDVYGRRDVVRTDELRAEIQRQDEEKRVNEMWEVYETRWRDILNSDVAVGFQDIPWPLATTTTTTTTTTAEEITLTAVKDFLFATLKVRSNSVSRRDRIRASILRWHPDKMAGLLVRVVPDDELAVINGINAVFRCLKELQDTERQ